MQFKKQKLGAFMVIAATFGMSAVPLTAQVQSTGREEKSQPGASEGLISVRFAGGSVADYVELLRGAMRPQPANIALAESAAGATLPPIQLDAVTIGTALAVIQFIAPRQDGENWVIAPLSDGQAGPPAYAVAVRRNRARGGDGQGVDANALPPGGPGRVLQVFSIKDLVDPPMPGGPTPETVLSVVDLALRTAAQGSGEPTAEVKFHPDSGLVILEAPPQQVGAIEGLLQRIRGDVDRQRERAERAGRQRLDDEMALRIASAKVQSVNGRLAYLEESMARLGKLRESGNISDDEVRNMQMQVISAQSDRDMAVAEAETAKARLNAGRAAAPGESDALRAQIDTLQQQVAALRAKIGELEARKK